MRIALYHNLLSGGAKRAVNEICQRLGTRHTIDVFTCTSANHEFADIRPLVNAHYTFDYAPGGLLSSPLGRLNQLVYLDNLQRKRAVDREIARAIDAGGYDVAFVHTCRIENSPSVLGFLRSTPSVFYCHDALRIVHEAAPARPYDRAESRLRRWGNAIDPLPALFRRTLSKQDQLNLKAAGRVLVNSQFTRETIQKIYGVTAQVAYLGVDVRLFRPLDLTRELFVLSVGSLTPLKGFDFIVRALARIPAAQRPEFWIVSNFQIPSERDFLFRLAHDCEVELLLMTNITDEALVRLYNETLLTAYAPLREPFGFVPIESMACGTPVVAVAEGGVLETVVDGVCGLRTARDEDAFAQAVMALLRDPDLWQRLAANGLASARENWSWEQSVAGIEATLLEAAA